jgi:hypothetical protein
MEPVAEAVLEIAGNAEMEYRMKERIKIIDTLSYPGLAIKGQVISPNQFGTQTHDKQNRGNWSDPRCIR